MTYKVKKATCLFRFILFIFEKIECKGRESCYVAMINPFTLNILTTKQDLLIGEKIYKHECKHIEQVKRDGRLKFLVKYLWWNITKGYKNNPYEVEAREAENK